MKYDEDVLNKLYLGISPSKYCNVRGNPIKVTLLSTSQILELDTVATVKYPDDTSNKNVYANMLVAYEATKDSIKIDFETFIEYYDLIDVDEIIQAHNDLLNSSPKIELINSEEMDELIDYFTDFTLQRYRWQLCQTFNMPPNVLFSNGKCLTDEQILWIFIMESIDSKTKLEHWCDECKEKLTDENTCWNCGQPIIKKDSGTSETFDDDEWLRRAYGIWNEETGRYEIPVNSTFDYENKCWISNDDVQYKIAEEPSIEFIEEDNNTEQFIDDDDDGEIIELDDWDEFWDEFEDDEEDEEDYLDEEE